MTNLRAIALCVSVVVILGVPALSQGTGYAEKILYNFTGINGDGAQPQGGLFMDSAGNLYGTTVGGGNTGCGSSILDCGTVFKLDNTGHETILYRFTGMNGDGYWPYSGVIVDGSGNFYGTTNGGGAFRMGTVFKLDAAGNETVLYSFNGAIPDAMQPTTGLISDGAGNLYGTTSGGGAAGAGAVFKVDAAGNETVLYSFKHLSGDGLEPAGGVIMDSAGNLYGTTLAGGNSSSNAGTVFKLDTTGHETVLYSFTGNKGDGVAPIGSLIMDSAGNLYGATALGGTGICGSGGCGTIFKLDNTGHEAILYSFTGVNGDGAQPQGNLIMDNVGNLYGTTSSGGTGCPPIFGGVGGCGIVFRLDNAGHETVLYRFVGINDQGQTTGDGRVPSAGLIMDSAGDFYGTTNLGGSAVNGGTVFKLAPVPDFSLGAAVGGSTSATISPGQSATYSLQANPINGFTSSVTLSCSGAPIAAKCSAPSAVNISGSSAVPFTVGVTTASATAGSGAIGRSSSSHPRRWPLTAFALSLPFVAIIRVRSNVRKRVWVPTAVLLCLAASMISCGGGGGSGGGGGGGNSGTPAGNYTLTVTAASGGMNRTLNLNLTIN